MYAASDSILVVIDGHGGGRDAAALAEALASSEDVAVAHAEVQADLQRLVEARGANLLAVDARARGARQRPRPGLAAGRRGARDHRRRTVQLGVHPATWAGRP
jgi:outer membrane protein TolC